MLRKAFIPIYLISFLSIIIAPLPVQAARGLSVQPSAPNGNAIKGEQWLFVIGIDTYLHWPRLSTAANDAKSVKKVLQTRYHFDQAHTIELYDEQATEGQIVGSLRWLALNLHEDDQLVIFYAGHGHLDSITKEGAWIPVESRMDNPSSWISNHQIKKYLSVDVIKAKHVLLISDSCFSGDFFRGLRGAIPSVNDSVIEKAYELNSRQAIASGGLEPVIDSGFGGNSVFTYFLLKELKANQKPYLVPSQFFTNIKKGVAENAEQFPQFGTLKDTGGQQGGEFVFFLRQKDRLENLSEQMLTRREELERLRQLEADVKEAQQKELYEINQKEKEIAELDQQILEMRKHLDTKQTKEDYGLNSILALVKHKEEQEKRLSELRQQSEAADSDRRAELAKLTKEKKEQYINEINDDIEKYKLIKSSPYGKDMASDAWKALLLKHPIDMEIDDGDTETLSTALILPIIGRDGSFVPQKNCIILDENTNLEWIVGPDKDTNYDEAKKWIDSLPEDGGQWRIPTIEELTTLFRKDQGKRNLSPLFRTSGWWIWSKSKTFFSSWIYYLRDGSKLKNDRDNSFNGRAFAVRDRSDLDSHEDVALANARD